MLRRGGEGIRDGKRGGYSIESALVTTYVWVTCTLITMLAFVEFFLDF